MKAMKQGKMAAAAFALVVGFALAASAEVTWKTLDNGFKYVVGGDDDPQPGVWDARYDKVIAYASANGIPVVAFYGKTGCARCNRLETELGIPSEEVWKAMYPSESSDKYCKDDYYPEWIKDGYPNYPEWIKKRGYLLLFGLNPGGNGGKVRALIKRGSSLPYVSVWWDKDGDGETDIGKANTLTWAGSSGNQHVSRLMKNSDAIISRNGGYSPIPEYAGGTFDFEETEGDRMECEEGTETVSFTLTRGEKESEYESEVILVAKGPDGDGVDRQTISWEEGESNKTVTVNIAGANFTEDGQQLSIILTDTNGVDRVTNHVTYVKKENSSSNPLWIGERASPKRGAGLLSATPTPNLEFGEWTMDLDAAKALAASTEGDAYTLVALVGALWCPDCEDTEKNFTGDSRFRAWAEENKVALVSIDVRRFDTNSVESVTGNNRATLLSRTPGTSFTSGSKVKSGRGYLTRKGVSDEDAAAILERNRLLVSTSTAEGGFHRAEDSDPYRTGVPYFVMLRKDGSVAARFTRYAAKGALPSDNWDDVIKRFDEMLAIAGKGETIHADAAEIENNHVLTTPLVIEANGGSASGEISHTDLFDAYKLGNFAGNATLSVMVTGDTAQVELSLWKKNADGTAQVLGSVTGQLDKGVTNEYTFAEAGEYYARVAPKEYSSTKLDNLYEFSHLNTSAMNFTSYTLTSEVAYYTPNAATATAKAPAGSKTVKMQLEEGVLYRFTGLDGESEANKEALAPVDGVPDFYVALKGDTVVLDAAGEGGEVEYQKWEPGAVGFAPDATTKKTEVTVSESQEVTVGYRRVEGVSGAVEVRVSLNKEETDFYYDYDVDDPENTKLFPRFTVNGDEEFVSTNVVWEDGQSLDECVGSLLVKTADTEAGLIQNYFGPGKVVFDIEIVAQTDAGETVTPVDNARFTVNFTEDQKPQAGTVAILDAVNDEGDGWAKKQTIYAREGGSATLTLGRLVSSQGPVYATIAKSVSTVVLGGDYEDDLVFWQNHKSDDKTVTVTNLPAAGKSVKLTLKASILSPELKVLSASNVVTIASVAADAPAFSQASYSDTVYRYESVSNFYPVVCEEGDMLSFSKTSGSLPSGLKATAAPGGMLVTGIPTGKDGAGKDYSAVFQVTATRNRKKVAGLTTAVNLTVKDPAVKGSAADGEALNDACAATKKFGNAMVFRVAESGKYAELAGMLTGLTLPATGKASAKFVCADGTISLSAKGWGAVNDDAESEDYGQMGVTLAGKGGYSLDIDVGRDGEVKATLASGSHEFEDISLAGTEWSATASAEAWKGYYTATLPVKQLGNPLVPVLDEKRAGVASRAAAYLTLTMTGKSDWNKGVMKWAGMLPNGEKVSGSSTLVSDEDGVHVYLPYVSFKAKDKFSGVAKIKGVGDTGGDEEESCYETVDTPKMSFDGGDAIPVLSVWRHSENNKATDVGDYMVGYGLYGGIYDLSLSGGLDCCCNDGGRSENMKLTISQPEVPSDVYGEFDTSLVDKLDVTVGEKTLTVSDRGGKQKLTLKFNAKTGVVTGKFNLSYDANGKKKTVSASYNGVVQLGFGYSCGCGDETPGEPETRPFLSGFWVFADKLSYQNGTRSAKLSVKRGAAITIDDK